MMGMILRCAPSTPRSAELGGCYARRHLTDSDISLAQRRDLS